ncbi:hypothetical protein IFM89_035690 [Coptis chinensis]|uniref:non-specific serine/threonine protein kinase n=1 Tax=Coptis chinensis TaxID=261450 RepID=A0A835M898_9MAGN|nr:hypothetical protein IFM89_035690 [Coptis chinensis]
MRTMTSTCGNFHRRFLKLTKLKELILSTCMMHGEIPASIGNMTSLLDIELSGNFLAGRIPKELGKLKNLQQLELYYNQHLSGEIPDELGNLTQLIDLDMSVNQLKGKIPESLCKLPNLRVLQLYNNSLSGEIPAVIGNSKTLHLLSLYSNILTGNVPQNLGELSDLIAVDLSENRLSGELPREVCKGGKLLYFCVLQNLFSGELPENYGKCKSLLRFRVSYNHLKGSIPDGLLALPHASIVDLGYNHFDGPIPKTIGNAKNLSELLIQGNRISGDIPSEISRAGNLVKIDLSNNLLSGPIPAEIGNLRKLNLLLLQDNKLNSSIPKSLSFLKFLNVVDLSNNLLTGDIPESICELLPNSINLSNNRLSGSIPRSLIEGGLIESLSGNPGLCVPVYLNSSNSNFPVCSKMYSRKKLNSIWLSGISVVVVIVGLLLFLKRWFARERSLMEQDDTFSSASFSYDIKSFHKITFDQREIIEALVDKNIVGHGGSGTVYKIDLSNGQAVAVKKLWTRKTKDPTSDDQLFLDKELKTEVQTLGSIRHKNIVKLYSYYSSWDLNLLVYEYMPNGNLWDALHRGRILLDWPTRHRIALGIAQGLSYLHHDLLPPIIHRDIKSTNILLNSDYQPKVADFGVAKVLLAKGKDSSTTLIAGTYGYLAPEVLDKRLLGSFRDEMRKVLRIAIRCTNNTPTLRPTMKEVIELLIEADPCRFECCKASNKINEASNETKIMNSS